MIKKIINNMEKINLVELLKDCPTGTKLYSPLCGECYFDRLNMGSIICKKQNTQEITFTSEGYYMLPVFDGCECVLFPSKENRDWSKFQRPFKDGDVICTIRNNIAILKKETDGDEKLYTTYCGIYDDDAFDDGCVIVDPKRIATEEEKEKLFKAIKDNGYEWNPETKILEKLPKFKVGDRIKSKISNAIYTVINIKCGEYYIKAEGKKYPYQIPFESDIDYKLVLDKFDINTLKPFESRVLVRDDGYSLWQPSLWGLYDKEHKFPYVTLGCRYRQCIPYEGNEHLLGTTDDCDEFYKNW